MPTLAVLALGVLALPACSDDDAADPASTTLAASTDPTTSTAAPGDDIAEPGEPASDVASTPGPPPTTADPDATTTSLLAAGSGVPDHPSTNSQGVAIVLDETALLACAQNQIAWVALQRGAAAEASDALAIAAVRAEASAVAEVKAFAPSLDAAADSATPGPDVDEFLALCVERGFEY